MGDLTDLNGTMFGCSYPNDAPDTPLIIFGKDESGQTRMRIELDKDDCEYLLMAIKEHMGLTQNV